MVTVVFIPFGPGIEEVQWFLIEKWGHPEFIYLYQVRILAGDQIGLITFRNGTKFVKLRPGYISTLIII